MLRSSRSKIQKYFRQFPVKNLWSSLIFARETGKELKEENDSQKNLKCFPTTIVLKV